MGKLAILFVISLLRKSVLVALTGIANKSKGLYALQVLAMKRSDAEFMQ